MLLSNNKLAQKNKIMLFIISLLSSLFFQILIFDADYNRLISFNNPRQAVITETNQYEIDGNSYTATSNQAQIFLDSDSLPIGGLHISFEKPLNYHLLFQIYYIAEGQVASVLQSVEGTCFATESDIFVSIPLGEYEEIRIDFNNNLDSSFLLKDIFFTAETPTALEIAFSKLSIVLTLLFLGLFFLIFRFMKTDVGTNFSPFFIVGILTAYYFSLQELFSDDTYYYILQKDLHPLLTYTVDNYLNWSSRQIIEAILYYIVHYKTLWALLSGIISALFCWALSKLLKTTSLQINCFITCMFFLYPFYHQSTAGWVATTTNYLWPFCFTLLALQTIKKSVYDEKITKKFLVFQCVITVYASNQEQLAALLCGFFTVFSLYFSYIKKSAKILYPQLAISVLSLIYHISSPGNAARRLFDIERYNISFHEFSLIKKLEMNYTYTLFSFFTKDNTIPLMFCIVLIAYAICNKKIASSIFVFIPFATFFMFHSSIQANLSSNMLSLFKQLEDIYTVEGTGFFLHTPSSWIPILLLTFVLVLILLSVFFLFDDKKKSLFLIITLLAGFASRLILFSSVTMNRLSATRTYMFLYFAFVVVALFIYEDLIKTNNKKYIIAINLLLATFAIIEVVLLFTKVNTFA